MTALVGPIVPPVLSDHRSVAVGRPVLAGRPVPLPTLVARRTSPIVYGVATLDVHGRIADRTVLDTLGWSAGLRLTVSDNHGVLIVQPDPNGLIAITRPGHFHLPAPLRHRCGLEPGDRVVLAADPTCSRLTIYPPATLDTLLHPPGSTGGDAA